RGDPRELLDPGVEVGVDLKLRGEGARAVLAGERLEDLELDVTGAALEPGELEAGVDERAGGADEAGVDGRAGGGEVAVVRAVGVEGDVRDDRHPLRRCGRGRHRHRRESDDRDQGGGEPKTSTSTGAHDPPRLAWPARARRTARGVRSSFTPNGT